MTMIISILVSYLSTAALPEVALELQSSEPSQDSQTRIDIDLKDADATDILSLIAELGQFNLVADPSVRCRLTMNLKSVTWRELMETSLRSCGLGEEWMGQNLVRVAPIDRLRKELEERREYEEQKKQAGTRQTTFRKLAYARAKDVAPLIKKFLSPVGEVAFDERTNTLIITDVAR
jgi:type IV pilus assembly protein PilQ